MMRTRRPVELLDRRLRLHGACRFDPEGPALWVRRKNPIERFVAWVAHRGETRVRLDLDARSAEVLAALVALKAPTGRGLAAHLGVPVEEGQGAAGDADLAALLVFLLTLWRAGALVTEPI